MSTRTTHARPDARHDGLATLSDEPEYASAPNAPIDPLDTRAPELAILLAVLERAVLDLGGRVRDGNLRLRASRLVAHDAFMWVMSDDDAPWSFGWVCDHLNLEWAHTRQRVFELAEQTAKLVAAGRRVDKEWIRYGRRRTA